MKVKYNKLNILSLFFILVGYFSASVAVAAATSNSLNFQGRIVKSDGTPLQHSNVGFIFQVKDPSGSCVIYQEQVSGINMTGSNGIFDVTIGTGTVSWPSGPYNIMNTFNNSSTYTCGACSGYTCSAGTGTYTPVNTDGRLLQVSFYDGNGWKTISPDTAIRAVPFAGYAQSAEKLGSHAVSEFVLRAGLPTCGSGTFLSYDGTNITCESGSGGGTSTLNSGNIFVGNSWNVATGVTPSGDLTLSNAGAFRVTALQNTAVSVTAPTTAGQILRYNGSAWAPNFMSMADLRSTVTGTSALTTSCSTNQTLVWSSATDGLTCTDIALPASQLTGTLGVGAGGTGATTLTANGMLMGNGTSAVSAIAPGTSGYVLTSNGTSSAPSWQALPTSPVTSTGTTGYVPVYSGAGALANSAVYQSSTNVGVGTTTPSGKLSVGSAAGENVYLFQDNPDIGDNNDGQSLYLARRAAEGDSSFRMYFDQYQEMRFTTDGPYATHFVMYPFFKNPPGDPGGYVPNFSGHYMPDGNRIVVVGEGWADNRATFVQFQSTNSTNASQRAYMGIVTEASGNSPSIVIGQQTASAPNNYQERLRIDPAGNVGIGTTAPTYTLHVVGTAGLSSGTSWANASDLRLKDIHGDYEYGLNEVLQLHTVRYNYKKDNALKLPSDFEKTGFIAQEVQKVIPDAVRTREDGYLELNVDPIHWAVVNAIKDLYHKWFADSQKVHREIANVNAKVQYLETDNAVKDQKIKELEARLQKLEKFLGH